MTMVPNVITARPYPTHLVKHITLRDGTALTIRPICPSDQDLEKTFVHELSANSRYCRFMYSMRDLSPSMLQQFTHPDYDQEMALIALLNRNGNDEEIAVARYVKYLDKCSCEFAIAVADKWQRAGVGAELLKHLIAVGRSSGLACMEGFVLSTNRPMLNLAKFLGFSAEINKDEPTQMIVRKNLSTTG
jgi:acetyltransferase